MPNRAKDPQLWEPDIARSVDEYNAWYLAHSPGIWADARGRAVEVAAQAMDETDNFREFTPTRFKHSRAHWSSRGQPCRR